MSEFNFHRSSGSRFIQAVRPGLLLGIMLMLLLAACGDQNIPVSSAVGSQAASSGSGTGQSQLPTTSASSKTTPKAASTAANGPAGTVHICSLLTKDEAAASLSGASVQVDAAADSLGEFGNASCNYVSSTSGLTVQVSILGQSKTDFENNFNALNAQAVSGLGDAAFYIGGQLSTLKGKVGVVVLLLNPADRSGTLSRATLVTQEILTALAKTSHATDLTSTGAARTTLTD